MTISCLKKKPRDFSGQALIEFALTSVVVFLVTAFVFDAFWKQWGYFQCIHDVFEATHQRMISDRVSFGKFQIDFIESENSIQGVSFCSGRQIVVELPYLEKAKW